MLLRSILATIQKEWLLLRRDWSGLALLLLMPAALIIIMALVQDAPFKDYQSVRFDLLLADEDGGSLAASIKEGLGRSSAFHVIPTNSNALRDDLAKGRYHIGVVIPKGVTAEVVNTANTIANRLAEKLGTARLPQRAARDSPAIIRLYFDPVAKPAFRLAITNALDKYLTAASTKLLVSRISRLSGGSDTAGMPQLNSITVREMPLQNAGDLNARINSVQHNVPAWAIFGIFFIVVPLSGHIIREREEGSALRVRLIPGAARGVGVGRIVFYAIVCCAQAVLMAAIGRWGMPLFGLSALRFGAHPAVLLPVIMATGLCATAYGFFVGSLFRSGTQALPFGAISVVILSALGGIWVPVEVLPHSLQIIARGSPLHWALDGVQTVMLRDGGLADVAFPVLLLLGIAALLWATGVRWGGKSLA